MTNDCVRPHGQQLVNNCLNLLQIYVFCQCAKNATTQKYDDWGSNALRASEKTVNSKSLSTQKELLFNLIDYNDGIIYYSVYACTQYRQLYLCNLFGI